MAGDNIVVAMEDYARPEFSTDKPILSHKEDKLNRERYACALAERIAQWKGDESLAIGLTGEWGCGKTSLKNLILERLGELHRTDDGKSAVSVMEFCPWELSQHGSLTGSFFATLSAHLGKNQGKAGIKAAKRVVGYSKTLGLGGSVLKTMGGAMTLGGLPIGVVLTAGGGIMENASMMAEKGAAIRAPKEKTLSEAKESLVATMGELQRPVLAIIDDIDRLTADEICEVFQIVKANGNLPNVIYLLLFDRAIVSESLDKVTCNHGDEYLEKIIQVHLHVPHPPVEAVHQFLFEGLNRFLDKSLTGKAWNKGRWDNFWFSGLPSYFNSLRDVHRYLSSFGFHASLLQTKGTPEVNPVDLVVTEALRIFEPSLFGALPDYRDELVNNFIPGYGNRGPEEKKREEVLGILRKLMVSSNVKNTEKILTKLFPALASVHSEYAGEFIKEHRVCTDKYFDRYFHLSLRETDVSEYEVGLMRENLTKPEAFFEQCQHLKKERRLLRAFELLDPYNDQISKTDLPDAILSLIKAADLDEPEIPALSLFGRRLDILASRQVYFSLKTLESEDERFALLKPALFQGDGVLLVALLVSHEQRDRDKGGSYLVSEEHAKELIPIAVARIRGFASNGRLRSLPKVDYVLWRWREFESVDAVYAWIDSQVIASDDALWVLRTFLHVMHGSSIAGEIFRRSINLEDLSQFAPTERIASLTSTLALDALGKDDMRALRAFRYALKWKTEGYPPTYTGPDTNNPLEENE